MKKNTKILCSVLATAILLGGCDAGEDIDLSDSFKSEKKNKPKVSHVSFTQDDIDTSTNIASIHVSSTIENGITTYIMDNNQKLDFTSGDGEYGYFNLQKGKHQLKVCATNNDGRFCSDEKLFFVSENLPLSAYTRYELKKESNGITNNGSNIIYGTIDGEIYTLDIDNNASNLLLNVNERISGLAHSKNDDYYYSSITSGSINKIDLINDSSAAIVSVLFPDGLDFYKNNIYSVKEDENSILNIYNTNGEIKGTINTGINDIVGISHTEKYLYILAEDGSIYQTNPTTGTSSKIFENLNLFDKSSMNNGLEGITIMNYKIYVSYVNDKSIYLIDINLADYE
jgi:hypothetical protein